MYSVNKEHTKDRVEAGETNDGRGGVDVERWDFGLAREMLTSKGMPSSSIQGRTFDSKTDIWVSIEER